MKILKIKIMLIFIGLFFIISIKIYPATIVITSDKQFRELQNPDFKLDLSTGFEKRFMSLREVCEEASKRGDHKLFIVFDQFYGQFRGETATVRKLKPDEEEYINLIKNIGQFAAKYGMGLGLSILSPLEIGPGFAQKTGQSGRWLQYKVGLRDPKTGKFSLQLWKQLYWTNNKGMIALKLKGVKAYAFKEKVIDNGHYSVVNPDDIKEIKTGIKIDKWSTEDITPMWEPSDLIMDIKQPIQRVRISCTGDNELKGYDRVFVILEYETPEMDYFSPKAEPFLKSLMKEYHDDGINLVALYSDELHIQQDWYYFNHHDNGEFAMRYLTKSMADTYCKLYDPSIEDMDMDKYMLYFVYGPKIYTNSPKALIKTQYVMGDKPEDIYRTILFRDRYYKLLNNRVVDLFKDAKEYTEKIFDRKLPTGGHATWAESPTIDLWDTGDLRMAPYEYEYTSNFLWSNTVQQAAAGCYDYFKWGEYLQPTGNDYAECGWADRDNFGEAMAVSIGIINKYKNAYAAYWGMPEVCAKRKQAIVDAYGVSNSTPAIKAITGGQPRNVDALILYPMNLVAADERFGSWMTQYGYANYITDEKLLELAKITAGGKIEMGGRTFSTLVALFEPIPQKGIIDFMKTFSQRGGKVIWCGPPPVIDGSGKSCLNSWEELFGVNYTPTPYIGQIASGHEVVFKNSFNSIPDQIILTGFLVDHIYPVEPRNTTEILANVGRWDVGTKRQNENGQTYFFGFRPRDDQSRSLGYETKTLFDILNLAGAYRATGSFKGVNDNTEYVSRTSPYLTTRFPNGTTIIAAHYRTQPEDWFNGTSRNDSADALALKDNPLPPDTLELKNFKLNGHDISFNGNLICAFNVDSKGNLISFEGHNCNKAEIDNKEYKFGDNKFSMIAWTNTSKDEGVKYGAFMKVFINGSGLVTLPADLKSKEVKLGQINDDKINYINASDLKLSNGLVSFTVTPEISGKWIYLCN
jgi:hypothetical protein